ncbi:MAG: hypothetical protein JWO59_996, partial [Chloroflexi bacterium]|nr:hypothetical protein [Chloroflexota bacterium]
MPASSMPNRYRSFGAGRGAVSRRADPQRT